jgi:hypothetical protein
MYRKLQKGYELFTREKPAAVGHHFEKECLVWFFKYADICQALDTLLINTVQL